MTSVQDATAVLQKSECSELSSVHWLIQPCTHLPQYEMPMTWPLKKRQCHTLLNKMTYIFNTTCNKSCCYPSIGIVNKVTNDCRSKPKCYARQICSSSSIPITERAAQQHSNHVTKEEHDLNISWKVRHVVTDQIPSFSNGVLAKTNET